MPPVTDVECRDGFEILRKISLKRLTDEEGIQLRRNIERNPGYIGSIIETYESQRAGDLLDRLLATESLAAVHTNWLDNREG